MCKRCTDVERLKKLNVNFDKELAIDMVLNSMPSSYDLFILTNHLKNMEMKLIELHSLLQTTGVGIKKSHSNNIATAPFLVIQQGKGKKRKAYSQPKWKGKAYFIDSNGGSKGNANFDVPPFVDPKEVVCFHYGQKVD